MRTKIDGPLFRELLQDSIAEAEEFSMEGVLPFMQRLVPDVPEREIVAALLSAEAAGKSSPDKGLAGAHGWACGFLAGQAVGRKEGS